MVNYQNGKIYKLVNNVNDKIYIGSTTQKLCNRKNTHKNDSKRSESKLYNFVNEIGFENIEIV